MRRVPKLRALVVFGLTLQLVLGGPSECHDEVLHLAVVREVVSAPAFLDESSQKTIAETMTASTENDFKEIQYLLAEFYEQSFPSTSDERQAAVEAFVPTTTLEKESSSTRNEAALKEEQKKSSSAATAQNRSAVIFYRQVVAPVLSNKIRFLEGLQDLSKSIQSKPSDVEWSMSSAISPMIVQMVAYRFPNIPPSAKKIVAIVLTHPAAVSADILESLQQYCFTNDNKHSADFKSDLLDYDKAIIIHDVILWLFVPTDAYNKKNVKESLMKILECFPDGSLAIPVDPSVPSFRSSLSESLNNALSQLCHSEKRAAELSILSNWGTTSIWIGSSSAGLLLLLISASAYAVRNRRASSKALREEEIEYWDGPCKTVSRYSEVYRDLTVGFSLDDSWGDTTNPAIWRQVTLADKK